MRKFLGTMVLLAMLVAGVGFFRGWFDVSTTDQPGRTNVEVSIDKEKIRQDAEAAKAKARELTSDDPSDTQESLDLQEVPESI